MTSAVAALGVVAGLIFSNADQAKNILICVVGPTTGALTQYGDMMKEGIHTAVKHINTAGSVNGRMLENVAIDDGCEAKQGPIASNRVLNSKISFVVGYVCSSAAIAAAEIYNNEGVVMVMPSSTAPAVTDGKNCEFIFRTICRGVNY